MAIPIFVQLMSGEILPMEFRERTGLYGLQRQLMDYCYDWKPMLQVLYRVDERGEYVPCRMYSFTPTEGERLYLVIRKQILHEQLYFVYTYENYELYRFVYSLTPHDGPRYGFTFTIKEGTQFSLDAQQWHQVKFPEKATWFSTVDEMLQHYSDTVTTLPDEVRMNLACLWEIRRT